MPDFRETIIRLDHGGNYAEVWTERPALAARLLRLGFVETQRQGRGVWLRGAIRQISFRNARRTGASEATRAHLAALAKANAARRRQVAVNTEKTPAA